MAVIDRDYWLNFAHDGISASIENRVKAAEKLDVFLTWVWTTYTSVFALASFFNFVSSDIRQLIFMAQPIVVIMVARYFCTLVGMPSTSQDSRLAADPNDVAGIIDSFKTIVEDKRRKLHQAKIWTLISVASLAMAIGGYNYFDPNKKLKQDLQELKLKKELKDNHTPFHALQTASDSLKLRGEYLDVQYQAFLKQRRQEFAEKGNAKGLDSIRTLLGK